MKKVGQENQLTLEKLPKSSRSRPPELKHGLNEPDQASQTISAKRRIGDGLLQLLAKEQLTLEKLLESSRSRPQELKLGLNGPDQVA